MTDVSLDEFSKRVLSKGRIGKYDVQSLQREILKDGITTRAEADLLIGLDREADSVHFSWSAFFISALTEFAVWQSGRPGYIDADKSEWLLTALAGEDATDRATRALVAIAQAAECFDEAFFAGSPSPAPAPATMRERRAHGAQELCLAA